MKEIVLMVLGLLAISVFLIGCSPAEVELVDEEGNLVGEAFRSGRYYKIKRPVVTENLIEKMIILC